VGLCSSISSQLSSHFFGKPGLARSISNRPHRELTEDGNHAGFSVISVTKNHLTPSVCSAILSFSGYRQNAKWGVEAIRWLRCYAPHNDTWNTNLQTIMSPEL